MQNITTKIDAAGNTRTFINNRLHCKDAPAVVMVDGTKKWYWYGRLHRVCGPAIEYPDGTRYWYYRGLVHREDGPAIEWPDGRLHWNMYGSLHRCDGPAIEDTSGTVKSRWFIDGIELKEVEFEKTLVWKSSMKSWISGVRGDI